jgi:hypothetical protein
MSLQLPQAIDLYVKVENSVDTEALSTCFAADATVRDEDHTYVGLDAIKKWKSHTKKRYKPHYPPARYQPQHREDNPYGQANRQFSRQPSDPPIQLRDRGRKDRSPAVFFIAAAHIRFWPKADMGLCTAYVRF